MVPNGCHGMLFEKRSCFSWTHDQFVSSYTARYAIVMCLWFQQASLKTTLDEDPRSMVHWNRPILFNKSHKLDPWPLDEGPRPKSGKSRLNLDGTIFEGKSIGPNHLKKGANKDSSWFEEPRCKLRSKARSKATSNSRVQFVSNEPKLFPTNLDLGSI